MPRAKVLFVCVENAGRSQMAEGFARKLGGELLEPWSAGSKPSGKINPVAVEVMKEHGIELSGHRSKGFAELPSQGWDYVVTMGCGDACPFIPAKVKLDWQLPDPKGQDADVVRRISHTIRNLVAELIERAAADGYGPN